MYFDSSGSSENPSAQAKKLNMTAGTNFFTLATLISAATGGHVVYQCFAVQSRNISLRDSAENYISFNNDL